MAEAQYQTSKLYQEGRGVTQNDEKALAWLTKSAQQGYELAQQALATVEDPQTTAQTQKRNIKKLKTEAKKGEADAQYELGIHYYNSKDYTQAFEWLEKSALQGKEDAQYSLGVLYYEGTGVTKDLLQAFSWIQKSAMQGDADAQYALAKFYFEGEGVTQDETKALEWLQKSAAKGSVAAKQVLATLQDTATTESTGSNFEALQTQAQQGDAKAQYDLGTKYYIGDGVRKDIPEAFAWFTKSATQDNADAQLMLGWMYLKGEGIAQNIGLAKKWLQESAAQGNEQSIELLNNDPSLQK